MKSIGFLEVKDVDGVGEYPFQIFFAQEGVILTLSGQIPLFPRRIFRIIFLADWIAL